MITVVGNLRWRHRAVADDDDDVNDSATEHDGDKDVVARRRKYSRRDT